MFRKHKCALVICLMICVHNFSSGQPILTHLPQASSCPGMITIPVEVEQFSGVSSISLKFIYDSLYLHYEGYQNPHPSLGSGMLVGNAVNQRVIISWFSLTPASIGTGTLIEIKFTYSGGQDVNLVWEDDSPGICVYTDSSGVELPATFFDGAIVNLMPPPQPLLPGNHSLQVSTQPLLHWTGTNCAPLYEVHLAKDNLFQDGLQVYPNIFGTSFSLNELDTQCQYFWKVSAFNDQDTTAWSEVWDFTTLDPDGIDDPAAGAILKPLIYPNPCSTQATLRYISSASETSFELLDVFGHILRDGKGKGKAGQVTEIPLDLADLSSGIYAIRLSTVAGEKKNISQFVLFEKIP